MKKFKIINTHYKEEPVVLILQAPSGIYKNPQKERRNLNFGEFVTVDESQIGDEIRRMVKKKKYITLEEVTEDLGTYTLVEVKEGEPLELDAEEEKLYKDLEKELLEEESSEEPNGSVPQGG